MGSCVIATGWRITFFESAQHSTVGQKRVNREREVDVCVFSFRAINITSQIPLSFDLLLPRILNTTTLQRLPQFLNVGTVYKYGLRVGVKICLKYMTKIHCL